MKDNLDRIAADCPNKIGPRKFNITFNIFNRVCRYTNDRCTVNNYSFVKDCPIYKKYSEKESELTEHDDHITNMGIGACDLHMASRMYND